MQGLVVEDSRMKLATTLAAAVCVLAGASSLYGRQPAPVPGPMQELLPTPQEPAGELGWDLSADDYHWGPPPLPSLPYGFTWENYLGAEVEHDIYGDRRLNPPPRKTVSCDGFLAALGDSVVVLFSYPTPNRPPPVYCCNQTRRCAPAKF